MKQEPLTIGPGRIVNEVAAILVAITILVIALVIQAHHYSINFRDLPILGMSTNHTSNSSACAGLNTSAPLPCGVSGKWNLAFDDEFNGNSLNSTFWAKKWATGSMNNVKTDPNNVSVSNGNLNLSLSSDSDGALVTTNPKLANPGFTFGAGYLVEARIYFPGNGVNVYNWPAFWAISGHSSPDGEVDIAEGTNILSTYFHATSVSNSVIYTPGTWTNSWHTYALDRERGKDYIYWDGKLIHTFNTDDGDMPDFIIINAGIQGLSTAISGPQAQVKVDYVRAWQQIQ